MSHTLLCDVHGCLMHATHSVPQTDNTTESLCDRHYFMKHPEQRATISTPTDIQDSLFDVDPINLDLMHPLLNPASQHYSMVDGVEAIERMEQMYSNEELLHWANISAMKYRLRIGNKDDVSKEVAKIKSYEAYYEYLAVKLGQK